MTIGSLEKVQDILDIQALKGRYCELADAIPLEGDSALPPFVDLFTHDVQGDYGLGPIDGRDALVAFFLEQVIAGQAWMWHALASAQVEVDGDNASGRWTVIARMKPKDAMMVQSYIGRYRDEFRRTPDGWKISGIRFEGELTLIDPYSADGGRVIFAPRLAT